MARIKKSSGENGTPIGVHQHSDSARLNIPDATQARTDVPKAKKPVYRYSPHLSPKLRFDSTGTWDQAKAIIGKVASGQKPTPNEIEVLKAIAEQGCQPWLEWANKHEREGGGSFQVDNVILHVHERVSAKAIIASVQKEEQIAQDFFARPKLQREQALQYYKHNIDWANRLILGDSLQVMSSLVNRENMAGKVQMIYVDPPYGIKFSSNWQNEVGKREVKDKDDDVNREPEVIKAYRDTWELGVHSYLSYLKDRFVLARELLSQSGSIFVQISDDNLHTVRIVMDEVFGPNNFISVITVQKTAGATSEELATVADYLIWYAKDINQVKYRQLVNEKGLGDDKSAKYRHSEDLTSGAIRLLTPDEKSGNTPLPKNNVPILWEDCTSQTGSESITFEFTTHNRTFRPSKQRGWRTNEQGLLRLEKADRLLSHEAVLMFKRRLADYAATVLTNIWTDTSSGASTADPKVYVVQTRTLIIRRCMLMTTEPGDLVLDPTCGSGSSAYVAEEWGRRWITIDSSRVALSIARQRLLTCCFESYKTKDPTAGVDPASPQNPAYGFYYKTLPHVTLKSIAQNRNLDPIFIKHEPILTAALKTLNDALIDTDAVNCNLVSKLKTKVSTDGARSVTDADLRRWLLPRTKPALLTFGTASQRKGWAESIPAGPGWNEWEVPFDADPDWPQPLQDALVAYRKAWRAKMDEVNSCITESAEQEELVDQPEVVRGVTRVSGPFSVEGVRPEELALGEDGKVFDPTINDFDELGSSNADGYIDLMISLLKKDGVTFIGNKRAEFATLEKEAGKSFHARGSWKGRDEGIPSVAVVFGPQYGPVNAPMTVEAIEAAKGLKEITDLVLAGFSFDVAAQEKAKEMDSPAFRIHLAHIRPDVSPGMQGLLKETPNSQLFTVFGQPVIRLQPAGDGEYKVEMDGVCIYNPLTGEISDTPSKKIAAWFLDTDYDGRCFCFSQAFFPDKTAWEKISKALGDSIPEGAFEAFTTSWPFKPGKNNRIAVKVIDPRGNEVMAIKTLNT